MEELVYYNELYDLYGKLLTDKQRKYFVVYFFNNLSLGEMAEEYNVSRNAIFKQIHNVVDKLKDYEEKLGLYSKKEELVHIIDSIDNKDIVDKITEVVDKF